MKEESITKQTPLTSLTDVAEGVGAPKFNENVGRPMTGPEGSHGPKYDIFGTEDVGEHFGRSGSPTGAGKMVANRIEKKD